MSLRPPETGNLKHDTINNDPRRTTRAGLVPNARFVTDNWPLSTGDRG